LSPCVDTCVLGYLPSMFWIKVWTLLVKLVWIDCVMTVAEMLSHEPQTHKSSRTEHRARSAPLMARMASKSCRNACIFWYE
jgi:hypothetical protein